MMDVAHETIDFDLPCSQCGYNLRTLRPDGLCGECGASNAASREAYDARTIPFYVIRNRGMPRMMRMRSDATFAAIVNLGAIVVGLLYGSPSPPFLNEDKWLVPALWLTPLVALFVSSCWATWRLLGSLQTDASFKRLGRTLVLMTLLGLALECLNIRWLRFYFDLQLRTEAVLDENVLRRLRSLGTLIFAIGWPGAIGVTAGIASRVFWLTRRRALAILVGGLGLGMATWLSMMMVMIAFHASDSGGLGSGELLAYLPGPTGASPMLGMLVGELRLQPAGSLFDIGLLLAAIALAAWPVLLRNALTRAIRLGELPAASSRS